MAALAVRGLPQVLCEGGPTLLAALAASGALDELCLTLSPVLAGPGPVRVLSSPLAGSAGPADQDALFPAQRLRLAQLLEEDGTLFARYLPAE
jgi:riboflavin biosynthesis pyrimidine reductase